MKKVTKIIISLAVCGMLCGVLVWYLTAPAPRTEENENVASSVLIGTQSTYAPYLYNGDVDFDKNLSGVLDSWPSKRALLTLRIFSPLQGANKQDACIAIAKAFGIYTNTTEESPLGITVKDESRQVEVSTVSILYSTDYAVPPTLPEKFISDDKAVSTAWNFINSTVPHILKNAYPHLTIDFHAIDADKKSDGVVTYYTTKVISFSLAYDDYPIAPRVMVRVNATGTVTWLSMSCDFAVSNYGWIDAKQPAEIINYLRGKGIGISKPPQNVKKASITGIDIYYVTSEKPLLPDKPHPPLLVPLYEMKITVMYNDGTTENIQQNLRVELA
ncbi:MAG: hypothetical protein QXH13_03405 [Thermoplasmata archaeon]